MIFVQKEGWKDFVLNIFLFLELDSFNLWRDILKIIPAIVLDYVTLALSVLGCKCIMEQTQLTSRRFPTGWWLFMKPAGGLSLGVYLCY